MKPDLIVSARICQSMYSRDPDSYEIESTTYVRASRSARPGDLGATFLRHRVVQARHPGV